MPEVAAHKTRFCCCSRLRCQCSTSCAEGGTWLLGPKSGLASDLWAEMCVPPVLLQAGTQEFRDKRAMGRFGAFWETAAVVLYPNLASTSEKSSAVQLTSQEILRNSVKINRVAEVFYLGRSADLSCLPSLGQQCSLLGLCWILGGIEAQPLGMALMLHQVGFCGITSIFSKWVTAVKSAVHQGRGGGTEGWAPHLSMEATH